MSVNKFYNEALKWVNAGRPIRSAEEMSRIHEICKQCPFFTTNGGFIPGYDKCQLCGCNLHSSHTTLNKIAWGTTECPDKPSRWGPDPE